MAGATTFRELLERYEQGERQFSESDLDTDPEDSLDGVCLDGIDLSRSFIVASFRSASLRGAIFRQANVKTCDFSNADLTRADFSGAALCATVFVGANLTNAQFDGAYYHSYQIPIGGKPHW